MSHKPILHILRPLTPIAGVRFQTPLFARQRNPSAEVNVTEHRSGICDGRTPEVVGGAVDLNQPGLDAMIKMTLSVWLISK